MYLTTINILGIDYKVYGLTYKEYEKNKNTLTDSIGTTDQKLKKIYISTMFWNNVQHKTNTLDWDEIENTIIHEIGHILEDIGGYGSLREEEIHAHHSELTWRYGKKYIPIIKKIWLGKKSLCTLKWKEKCEKLKGHK